jgi:hypothetical protein
MQAPINLRFRVIFALQAVTLPTFSCSFSSVSSRLSRDLPKTGALCPMRPKAGRVHLGHQDLRVKNPGPHQHDTDHSLAPAEDAHAHKRDWLSVEVEVLGQFTERKGVTKLSPDDKS